MQADDAAPLSAREITALAGLLAVAALVRVLRFADTSLMFNDGPIFITLARVMSENRFSEALAHPYHPLYPFFTLVAWLGIGDWERAAAAVSIVSGTVAVLLLFLFTRDAFGRTPGWIAGVVLATQARAVEWSADVQSDGLYLALFLGAVLFLWRALRTGRTAVAGWAGAFTGLAYLARPEGVGVLLVGGAILAWRTLRGRWSPGRAAGVGAAFVGAALLVMGPYLVTLRISNGVWVFSQKKQLTQILGVPEAEVPSPASGDDSLTRRRAAREWMLHPPAAAVAPSDHQRLEGHPVLAPWEVCHAASRALRPWVLPLLLLGVAIRRGRPGEVGAFVGLIVLLYFAVLVRQDLRYGMLARPAPHVPAPRAGVRLPGVRDPGGGRCPAGQPRQVAPRPGAQRPDGRRRGERAHGRRRSRPGVASGAARSEGRAPGCRVAQGAGAARRGGGSRKGRLAFYADRPYVSLHGGPPDGLLAYLRENGVRFVIIDDERLQELPELGAARGSALRLLASIEDRGRETSVYELSGGI